MALCESAVDRGLVEWGYYVDSVDQDRTAQNVQSALWSTLSTFWILDYNWTVSLSYNRTVFSANEKNTIYFFGSEIVKPLPDDKILEWPKLKQIANDILKYI